MVKTLVVILAIGGVGYWYWTGSHQQGHQSPDEERLQENARNMESCMRRESSMNSAAGMGGVGGIADDGKTLCADKYNLYFSEGQWRKNTSDDDDY
jgi:hypothetical protein